MKISYMEFILFLVVGFVNTATSYVVYLITLTQTSYQIAFVISYIAGVLISFFLNTKFTFKEKATLARFLQFPLVYFLQYGIGALSLWLLVEWMHIRQDIAPLFVAAISIPITFLLSRRIIREGLFKSRA